MRRVGARLRAWRALQLTRTRLGRRANLAQYHYPFTPEQLWALCEAVDEALAVEGAMAEVGVERGDTTVYLHRHLAARGAAARPYFAIDTFAGFTPDDMAAEHAADRRHDYATWFTVNSRALFEAGMREHGLGNVKAVEADATTFDYSTLPPLAFAFVDVDLERPVAAAIAGCWERLVPGGVIVVDDCAPGTIWEGALVAYRTECTRLGVEPEIRAGKLGLLRKRAP